MTARSKVTDLGEFYRKKERDRILTWLREVDTSLRDVNNDPEATDDDRADAVAGHRLIGQLIEKLKEA